MISNSLSGLVLLINSLHLVCHRDEGMTFQIEFNVFLASISTTMRNVGCLSTCSNVTLTIGTWILWVDFVKSQLEDPICQRPSVNFTVLRANTISNFVSVSWLRIDFLWSLSCDYGTSRNLTVKPSDTRQTCFWSSRFGLFWTIRHWMLTGLSSATSW